MKFEVAYRAADGKMAETTVEVPDRNAVYAELRRRGITPLSLREAGSRRRAGRGGAPRGPRALRALLVALLAAAAAVAVWTRLLDEGAKRNMRRLLSAPSKVDIRRFGLGGGARPEPEPRKGTGKAVVRIAE